MNRLREFEQSKREGAVTMVETEEKSNRRSGEAVSGGWKLALTSSKLLVFAIMAGLIATVAAEISGLLPFSILKLETIAYLLFGVAALCFLAWIVLISAGVIKKIMPSDKPEQLFSVLPCSFLLRSCPPLFFLMMASGRESCILSSWRA